jgi:S-adenosylmethionine synthetase
MKRLFTSESVTQGHPDKICDQISDAVLDEILKCDERARVACETAVNTGLVLVMGEITTDCYVDIAKTARKTIRDIGFTRAKYGFDADTCGIILSIDEQSPDIAMGVDKADQGAGDQGMMFGFACRETEELMPLPITLAHRLTQRLAKVREDGTLSYLRPDGKAQVTVEYDGFTPVRVDAIVVSTQHGEKVSHEQIEADLHKHVINSVIPAELLDDKTKYYVNPTGRFVIGGPAGDSGLTGRKIIVDTYGGYARHGGGAFSGKDPSKVDRSAAYATRHIAKNVVAAGLAERCEIEVAYAIGVARPVSVYAETFGTGVMSDIELSRRIIDTFDLRPAAIIERLGLRAPIYLQTASYGHFGRPELNLPWERLDMVDKLG